MLFWNSPKTLDGIPATPRKLTISISDEYTNSFLAADSFLLWIEYTCAEGTTVAREWPLLGQEGGEFDKFQGRRCSLVDELGQPVEVGIGPLQPTDGGAAFPASMRALLFLSSHSFYDPSSQTGFFCWLFTPAVTNLSGGKFELRTMVGESTIEFR